MQMLSLSEASALGPCTGRYKVVGVNPNRCPARTIALIRLLDYLDLLPIFRKYPDDLCRHAHSRCSRRDIPRNHGAGSYIATIAKRDPRQDGAPSSNLTIVLNRNRQREHVTRARSDVMRCGGDADIGSQ